jgi:hypothetical protein
MKSNRVWWVSAGLCAAAAMTLVGCGGSEDQVALKEQPPLTVPIEAQQAVAAAALPSSAQQEEGEVVAGADSLAPEVEVETRDPIVTPGKAIEITAIGSDDVREVELSDGRGKTTSFVYDLPTRTWKAYYRVPMKSGSDRLGLSVTAKNEGRRWRRVWLFLEVRSAEMATVPGSSSPDSTR